MNERRLNLVKILSVAAALVLATFAGLEFRQHRTFREPTVLGPGVTKVVKLGDYFPGIKDTINDCNVYVLDSGKPGGAALVIGGTHPEEPAPTSPPRCWWRRRCPPRASSSWSSGPTGALPR